MRELDTNEARTEANAVMGRKEHGEKERSQISWSISGSLGFCFRSFPVLIHHDPLLDLFHSPCCTFSLAPTATPSRQSSVGYLRVVSLVPQVPPCKSAPGGS